MAPYLVVLASALLFCSAGDARTINAAPSSAPDSLSCSGLFVTPSGSINCAVQVSGPVPSGGIGIQTTTGNPGVIVPTLVVLPAIAANADFTVQILPKATTGIVKFVGTFNGITKPVSLAAGTRTQASHAAGSTYYLAPATDGGNDTNDGLSPGTPWRSPKHAVQCGDVLLAAAGNYSAADFSNGKWGTVSCPAKNNLAWVKCATFDTCRIFSSSQADMFISASYWGVQGWEVSTTGGGNTCINIAPAYFNTSQIDHIVIANNIANRCDGNGISSGNGYGTQVGTDYLAYLGNIAYDTGHNFCAAGMSFWAPVASDTLPGTHYYMSGNFAWNNHSTCGDAEGIILDTLDGVEAGHTPKPYDQRVVATNNLLVFNDGPGIQVDLNMNGSPDIHAPVYMSHNTLVNNGVGTSSASYCAQLVVGTTVNTEAFRNLSATYQPYCFGASSVVSYAEAVVFAPSSSNKIHDEYAYSSSGHSIGNIASSGFTPGPDNVTTPDPAFVNPVRPGPPNCSGKASVPDCMATVIANFTPTNNTAKSYGYQVPTDTPVSDPLFPQWLCGVTNLPPGLVTMGCAK